MADFFGIINQWDAGPLEDAQGTNRLKRRAIGPKLYQFKKEDIRSRTLMGQRTMKMATKLKAMGPLMSLIQAEDVQISDDVSEEERKRILLKRLSGAFINSLADVIEALADDEFSRFVFELCEKASVEKDGKFVPLTDSIVYEDLFDEDLTLQIPVALSVLEVNLANGFFDKIMGVIASTE